MHILMEIKNQKIIILLTRSGEKLVQNYAPRLCTNLKHPVAEYGSTEKNESRTPKGDDKRQATREAKINM